MAVSNILALTNGGKNPVKRKTVFVAIAIAGILGGELAMTNVAQAFNMGNMMNPGRWFGNNNNNNNNDDYYDRRYGRYGPYGYGGGPYGYGGGPYGYGGGPYGYGGYPGGGYGRGYPSTIVVNPQPSGGSAASRAPR